MTRLLIGSIAGIVVACAFVLVWGTLVGPVDTLAGAMAGSAGSMLGALVAATMTTYSTPAQDAIVSTPPAPPPPTALPLRSLAENRILMAASLSEFKEKWQNAMKPLGPIDLNEALVIVSAKLPHVLSMREISALAESQRVVNVAAKEAIERIIRGDT